MSGIAVDTVRLDANTKTQLSTLKRRTGIENWNVLCRWAFCLSLADKTPVRNQDERGSGAIEMTWKTFAGDEDELYKLLLEKRCKREVGKIDKETMAKLLRQHIARGAARLAAKRSMKSISDFIEMAIETA
jgi:DNA sulfur modification protein DndE